MCDCCNSPTKQEDLCWYDYTVSVDGRKMEAGALLCPTCYALAIAVKVKKGGKPNAA